MKVKLADENFYFSYSDSIPGDNIDEIRYYCTTQTQIILLQG
jgi:hypothetical protein